MVQWGVAESTGNATASISTEDLNLVNQSLVEIGVSRGAGSAMTDVLMASPNLIKDALIGAAEAIVDIGGGTFRGDSGGNAQFGVSHGAGNANAEISFNLQPHFGPAWHFPLPAGGCGRGA